MTVQKVVQRLSQHNLKILNHRHIWKLSWNRTMIQINVVGMAMISYCTKNHLSNYNSSWAVSLPLAFVFLGFHKNDVIKSCSPFEDLPAYKVSWSHFDWCKFCIRLRNMNFGHFGMVEDTGLTSVVWRSTSMYEFPTKFHIRQKEADRMMTSYASFSFLRHVC
jgi:hypothetical protein